MSDIPSVYGGKIQEQETQFKAGVSEYTSRRMGANLNWIKDKQIHHFEFKINELLSSFAGKSGVDGLFVFPFPGYIVDVVMYGNSAGSSGTTEFNLLYSTFPAGSFTSIFSTTPKITTSAAAYSSVGLGDSVTGCTAPVLTTNPYPIAAKSRLRMDVPQVQLGTPRNFGINIYYIPA